MPNCRLCGAQFAYWLRLDGRTHNLSNRKYCLTCSPFGKHNTRQLEGLPPEVRQGKRVPRDPSERKLCPRCGEEKSISEFHLRSDGFRAHAWCKLCNNSHRKARFQEDRLAALLHYGNGEIRCACCGETRLEFLALDHVNDDGAAHRRELRIGGGVHFYSWLRKTGYTYKALVVACHNCNMARSLYGQCPHKRDGPVAQLESAARS